MILKEASEKIKNPLSGEVIEENGSKYTLWLNNDGFAESTLITKLPKKDEIKRGEFIQVQIDKKNLGNLPQIIEKISKKSGIPKEDIRVVDKEEIPRPESKVITFDNNNKLLLGFTKILVETAIELIPGYINTKLAKKYIRMLFTGFPDHSLKEFINPDETINKAVYDNIGKILAQYSEEHIVLISGYSDVGLIAYIKIFDLTHVQVLSTNQKFYKHGMIVLYNNFKSRKVNILAGVKTPNGSFRLMDSRELIFALAEEEFYKVNSDQVLYYANGKVAYNSIFEIVNEFQFPRQILGDLKTHYKTRHYSGGKLFVNSRLHGKLLPIEFIELNHEMKSILNRKK